MTGPQDLEQRTTLVLVGIENRLGKDGARSFYDRVLHESRSELEFTGALTDDAFGERVLWRLERKLEQLIEEEKAK